MIDENNTPSVVIRKDERTAMYIADLGHINEKGKFVKVSSTNPHAFIQVLGHINLYLASEAKK